MVCAMTSNHRASSSVGRSPLGLAQFDDFLVAQIGLEVVDSSFMPSPTSVWIGNFPPQPDG